jgi:hypothetical protein
MPEYIPLCIFNSVVGGYLLRYFFNIEWRLLQWRKLCS